MRTSDQLSGVEWMTVECGGNFTPRTTNLECIGKPYGPLHGYEPMLTMLAIATVALIFVLAVARRRKS